MLSLGERLIALSGWHQCSQSDIAEAGVELSQDISVTDEAVELSCHSAVLASDEICTKQCSEHVGRDVIHVSDGSGNDEELSAGRGSIDSFGECA